MSISLRRLVAPVIATALATQLCVPITHAATVRVENGVCTITFNNVEKASGDFGEPAETMANSPDGISYGLQVLGETDKELAKYKRQLDAGKISQKEYDEATGELVKKRDAYISVMPAIRACAEGRNLKEAESQAQAFLSSPDGKGLTAAGAGITAAGVIVAVLGAILAAYPFFKNALPAALQAVLP
ncbi:hypothetical protein ACX3U9_07505 [Corynebacterium pyruviciproducens]|uniref:hypothetical protein n=1 Tax=Corynebacterium pyruviciproducens TaxID=598660 RepID=UPI0025516EE4|nr:hypothetical protein [Corynebacterium pyruviciproducens]MDK7213258.1 hypothetical protein [Corynebacterium pyruviciproducens]